MRREARSGEGAGTPEVSVVMPAFNAAASLPDAAGSVLAQTMKSLELIIVDDGSIDTTRSVALGLAAGDDRVRVLVHESNRGAAAARNTALAAARGTWIAVVDADDVILERRLANLCALARKHDAEFVADNLQFEFDIAGRRHVELAFAAPGNRAVRRLSATDFIDSDMPSNGKCSYGYLKPLMQRAFLERHGLRYQDGLRICEDFDLYLRTLILGGHWLLDARGGYVYRQSPGSLTRSPERAIRNLEDAVRCNRGLQAFAREYRCGDLADPLRQHQNRLVAVLWFRCLRRGAPSGEPVAGSRIGLLRPLPNLGSLVRFLAARLRSRLRPSPSLLPMKR